MFKVVGWSLPSTPVSSTNVACDSQTKSKKRKRKEVSALGTANTGDSSTKAKTKARQDRHHGSAAHSQTLRPTAASSRRSAVAENNPKPQKFVSQLSRQNYELETEPESCVIDTNNTISPLNEWKSTTSSQIRHDPSKLSAKSNAKKQSCLTPLQSRMQQKLKSAQFRHLNEILYTISSVDACQLLESNADFFNDYHDGFRQQVAQWPENPATTFVSDLIKRSKIAPSELAPCKKRSKKDYRDATNSITAPLPSRRNQCHVADLGCGDADIAQRISRLEQHAGIEIRVNSYDLQAANSFVSKADISKLPVHSAAFDICIFCLSLMGTNWIEYINEASRVLQPQGELWIAETKSRFATKRQVGSIREEHAGRIKQTHRFSSRLPRHGEYIKNTQPDSANPEDCDLTEFLKVLDRRNFVPCGEQSIDKSNKMFVKLRFRFKPPIQEGTGLGSGLTQSTKVKELQSGFEEASVLKPCLYKTR